MSKEHETKHETKAAHKPGHKHEAGQEPVKDHYDPNLAETQTEKAPSPASREHEALKAREELEGINNERLKEQRDAEREHDHNEHKDKKGLVKVVKGDDVLHIHPDVVEAHEEAGWTKV